MGAIVENGKLTGSLIEDNLLVDLAAGKFYWRWKPRVKEGQRAGVLKRGPRHAGGGYRVITINQVHYRAHHLMWACCTGKWPEGEIDHINGNRDDNRIENLRAATVRENRANKRIQSNNRSGFKWVYQHNQTGRWIAEIRKHGQRVYRSSHGDPKIAYEAACEAAKKIHGEFFNPG